MSKPIANLNYIHLQDLYDLISIKFKEIKYNFQSFKTLAKYCIKAMI